MTQPAEGSWFRKPVKESWSNSYWFGVLVVELSALGGLVFQGGPFWPPYLLLALIVGGILVGLLGARGLRRVLGLPVIPRKKGAAAGDADGNVSD